MQQRRARFANDFGGGGATIEQILQYLHVSVFYRLGYFKNYLNNIKVISYRMAKYFDMLGHWP